MKKLLPSHPWSNGRGSITLVFALALTLLFAACGDDDSSSFVEPEKESSDSGATLSGDSHEGSRPSSCSSKEDKSSSSVSSSSTNSSSSAKSSSSTDSKSSSSVTSSSSGTSAGSSAGNSSSAGESKFPCSEEGKKGRADGVNVICHDGYWVPVSSSSAVPTSSYFDMTNQFNEKVSYGEFTDPRDGQKYRTVEVKNGVFMESYTFFAENLNYGKMVSGGSVQGDSSKYCYDDDPWYCENGWGGLYTWSRAMNFPAVCDSVSIASEKCPNKFNLESDNEEFNGEYYFVQHQGICPEGWHIMNENEWVEISEKSSRDVALYMGSKVAGFGNNSYGLSILPAGYWQLGKFDLIKVSAGFYLPQQYDNEKSIARAVYVETSAFNRSGGASKIHALSIRCVKNY